eukprot:TRINITY_DN10237_c0_g1_i11.p1 TRINITY_DN10237_c0_g1~~TRINITY_DN10237_c0_g1_i11.p1  ORF type:complete len:431 (-),score=35.53 TRINITY_DN10237_c0_g1_i11:353-1645(-)
MQFKMVYALTFLFSLLCNVRSVVSTILLVSDIGSEGIAPLGINLYPNICSEGDNCVFSPYSLYISLSMLAQGAEGTTKQVLANVVSSGNINLLASQQTLIQEVIQFLNQNTGEFVLSSANNVYINEGLEIMPMFQTTVQDVYAGVTKVVDFAGAPELARTTINNDVSAATEGLIPELIPSGAISPTTIMALTNAIYFKSNWIVQFDSDLTENKPFFVEPGSPIQVPTMFASGLFRTRVEQGAIFVELPYASALNECHGAEQSSVCFQDWDVSMVIVLPAENENLATAITADVIEQAFSFVSTGSAPGEVQVDLSLPKFDMEFDAGSVKSSMEQLGLAEIFDPASADFSGIVQAQEPVYVSDIFHKAKITVNEEGTEAAAATAAFLDFESNLVSDPVIVEVNRPFAFMILYKPAASILFMGQVTNPTQVVN